MKKSYSKFGVCNVSLEVIYSRKHFFFLNKKYILIMCVSVSDSL